MSRSARWFRKKVVKPNYQFKEGHDFHVVPDLEAARRNDPHPWNIYFLQRIFKVHYLRIPDKASNDGKLHIDIKAEVLYGDPFTQEENQQVGALLMELVQRNLIERD